MVRHAKTYGTKRRSEPPAARLATSPRDCSLVLPFHQDLKLITQKIYLRKNKNSSAAFLQYFFVQEKTKNMVYIATMPRKTKKRTCKPHRVRKNPDGSLNQKDMEYNKKCEQKYMFADNPWMKQVLSSKKPKGYDKYLKHLVKKRIKTLKKK